jgi:hypothetical protein
MSRHLLEEEIRDDVRRTVTAALRNHRIVNVSAIAENVRLRHEASNVALEDIEAFVLQVATSYSAPMAFDRIDMPKLPCGCILEVMPTQMIKT